MLLSGVAGRSSSLYGAEEELAGREVARPEDVRQVTLA